MDCEYCGDEILAKAESSLYQDTESDQVFCSRECLDMGTREGEGRKDDMGKLRFDLIPPEVTTAIARVLTYGARKYDANNWQNLSDFRSRYTAALMRHLEAYRAGREVDPESGLRHIDHVLCNAAFLSWWGEMKGRGAK